MIKSLISRQSPLALLSVVFAVNLATPTPVLAESETEILITGRLEFGAHFMFTVRNGGSSLWLSDGPFEESHWLFVLNDDEVSIQVGTERQT